MFRVIFVCVTGLAAGLLISGGVFTVLVAVGLIPRFAAKTRTAHRVKRYENNVVVGTIIGCILSVVAWEEVFGEYRFPVILANIGIAVWGLFSGIFVGCLAMAIAEMLNTIPIYIRRIRFLGGLRYAIWGMAIGKMVGSLLYFAFRIYEWGG